MTRLPTEPDSLTLAYVNSLDVFLPALVRRSPHVTGVELRGSQARGDAGPFSDWDFVIWTDDVASASHDLPALVQPLSPLMQQWDRLSSVPCYMLMIAGPTKIDLIFEGHLRTLEPPWTVTAETLPGIDAHFWDWTLWLASKVHAGKTDMVTAELQKLFDHLLAPLGSRTAPASLAHAIEDYQYLLTERQSRLGAVIDPEPGRQVISKIADLTVG